MDFLNKKIAQYADDVDGMNAKHRFFAEFVWLKMMTARAVKRVMKKESLFEKLLKRFEKGSKGVVNAVRFEVKRHVFEIVHFEKVVKDLITLERERMSPPKAGSFLFENFVFPFKEIIAPFKLLIIETKIALLTFRKTLLFHHLKTLILGVSVFAVVFTVANSQAFLTLSSHYISANIIEPLTAYQNEKTYQESLVLQDASEELIVAEEEKMQVNDEYPLDFVVTPDQNRIEIPRIEKDIPIAEVEDERTAVNDLSFRNDVIQKALEHGVVRYPGTAVPGQQGNVFLTGHSSYYLWAPGEYKDVFALLHKVEMGDEIIVYYGTKKGNQKKYVYEVDEIKEVMPDQVDVLKQTDDYRLTLMTCTPIGTNLRRLIVIAKQKDM